MIQTAEQYEFVHRALSLFERTLPDQSGEWIGFRNLLPLASRKYTYNQHCWAANEPVRKSEAVAVVIVWDAQWSVGMKQKACSLGKLFPNSSPL
jgi:hypothetical protein